MSHLYSAITGFEQEFEAFAKSGITGSQRRTLEQSDTKEDIKMDVNLTQVTQGTFFACLLEQIL